jgi:hypothetical protein
LLRATNAYLKRKSLLSRIKQLRGGARPPRFTDAARRAVLCPAGQPRAAVPTCSLHQALIQHRVGYFEEASDVGAIDQIAGRAVFLGSLVAVAVDGNHDFVELVIHFLAGP